jgi:hypothetical protein
LQGFKNVGFGIWGLSNNTGQLHLPQIFSRGGSFWQKLNHLTLDEKYIERHTLNE